MLKWTVLLYPATSPIDLISVAEKSDLSPAMCTFKVSPETRPDEGVDSVNRAKIVLRSVDEKDDAREETIHVTDGRPRDRPRQTSARRIRRGRIRDRIRKRQRSFSNRMKMVAQ